MHLDSGAPQQSLSDLHALPSEEHPFCGLFPQVYFLVLGSLMHWPPQQSTPEVQSSPTFLHGSSA